MKKIAIPFLAMILFISYSGMSQSRTDLKGPAAKNYKPWKNKTESKTAFVVVKSDKSVKGPEAKNKKVWASKEENETVLAIQTEDRSNRLMGPEAKNKKPWTDAETAE